MGGHICAGRQGCSDPPGLTAGSTDLRLPPRSQNRPSFIKRLDTQHLAALVATTWRVWIWCCRKWMPALPHSRMRTDYRYTDLTRSRPQVTDALPATAFRSLLHSSRYADIFTYTLLVLGLLEPSKLSLFICLQALHHAHC